MNTAPPSPSPSHSLAASFVLRQFTDASAKRIPNQIHIDLVQKQYLETEVKILCHSGQRLSDNDQDVQSFRYTIVNMDGET